MPAPFQNRGEEMFRRSEFYIDDNLDSLHVKKISITYILKVKTIFSTGNLMLLIFIFNYLSRYKEKTICD